MADNRFKVMTVGDFKESTVDCPVQLKKYQIIYDLIADKTYLRVVLENFSNQKIVGVFLNVDCLDIFEKKFAEVAKVSVKVECDKKYSEFGKECPIIIPKGTKTVKAYISRVVFSDMTVWENRDLTFVAPVSDLKPYTAIKEKNQLEKELAKRNYVAKYLPVRYENSWRCTCGHLNGNLNDVCSACRSRASILFNIFDDKNLEICKKEDTYNEARKFDTSKEYLQASKLYSTILDYKDSKVLFAKALENSKEAIYTSALDTLKTAQKEEDFDSAIKSLSSISEYKDAKTQIEKAKEQKNEFIYNQALQRVKKDNVGKNDFDKSISDMQRIPSYKDSREKIKEIDAQKRAFLDKKEHTRKMKKVRNISIVACVIAAIVIAILIPYFVEPNLYTKETTYDEITIGDQSGYCLARYNENEEKVVIPSEYLGKPVLKIGERAFQGKSIKEITIPESVRQIGYDAFAKCKNLNAVYYTDIEKWCQISFGNSNANPLNYAHNLYLNGELLTDLTISDSVAVDQYTFVGCSALQNITADSVIASTIARSCQSPSFNVVITHAYGGKIDRDAFNGCKGLKNITLPADVKSIGYEAFRNCNNLENIYFNGDVAKWCVISGLGRLMSSSTTLYIDEKKVEGELIIPDSVTSIGDQAFCGCIGLTSVTIPNSVTSIGGSAFSGCSGLTSVTIPNSVTSIGWDAFRGCYRLIEVYNKSTLSITAGGSDNGYVAYYAKNVYTNEGGNKLSTDENGYVIYTEGDQKILVAYTGTETDLVLPSYITQINQYAFRNCTSLMSVAIPDSVTSIGNEAFRSCTGLTSVAIPDGVTYIGDSAFKDCSGLTSVTIPGSVTSIGESAFYNCSGLTSVTIHSSITSIGDQAFCGCTGLTSVTIPDSVTSIGGSAFSGCSGLTSVTIPDSVTSIGESAFYNCSGLTKIIGPSTVASTVAGQCESKSFKVVITSGTSIGDYAFSYCSGLTSITIPDSVTSISSYAFESCTGLTSVIVDEGNTRYRSVGNCLIEIATKTLVLGCKTSVIPTDGSVTSIGFLAFSGCSGLVNITIPESVTSIGGCAFQKCTGLKNITIPDSVTSIGVMVFSRCTGLTSITISDSVTSIGPYAFQDTAWYENQPDGLVYAGKFAYTYKGTMPSNTSIVLKEGTLGIVYGAFSGCAGLTSITIPNSVTSIDSNAFSGCAKLKTVFYAGTEEQWKAIAIGSNNSSLTSAKRYYYSEERPTTTGNYWHYDEDGVTPVIWD